ncbi:MAG: NUDIX hydrolase [Actinomycetota bacterium]|nr:NUDIX domain-containing protein [Actinomycetota bacterium]
MKTERATSAGGVVVDERGYVLMIARRSPAGKVQWTLPKGLVEHDERPEETAVREVAEETGVPARITGSPTTIDYWFVWKPDDTRYHKFVHYFPMCVASGERTEPDGEAEAVGWFSAEDAIAKASFTNERAVLREFLSARKTENESTPPATAPQNREKAPRSKSARKSSSR